MTTTAKRFRKTRGANLFAEFGAIAQKIVDRNAAMAWPSDRWARDPVGFCTEVLGVEHLTPEQIEILVSLITEEKVAVRSGQKTGKTKLATCAALWWYASFKGAQVVFTANTKDQVRRVVWKELRETFRNAKKKLDGKLGENPERGLQAEDGRCIVGVTARDIETLAGISGANLLFIADEASGLTQQKAEALEGNRMGGNARALWISNPTRAEGPFFEAFHVKREFWRNYHLDSEKTATWQRDHGVEIPGLANLRRIEQWKLEYGEESPFYLVRVRGEFLRNEAGKPITLEMITRAQERWADEKDDEGDLSIGIDPAGPGQGGDETTFAVVRGKKLLALYAVRSLTEDGIIEYARGLILTNRRGNEIPRVVIDSEGPIGSALYGRMRELAERLLRQSPQEAFEAYGVKASQNAKREPQIYERVREELFAVLARWMMTAAILPDHKLETELHAPNWLSTVAGKLRLTAKEDLREKLGRSPDRADALALAVWQPYVWVAEQEASPTAHRAADYERAAGGTYRRGDPMDPYASTDWTRQ